MGKVKLCILGHENDVNAMECIVCERDISSVVPVDREEIGEGGGEVSIDSPRISSPSKTLRLQSLHLRSKRDGHEIEIPLEGGIIGREGTIDMEYFARNPYVSSRHAEICLQGAGFVIRDLGSTNGTKLNGAVLERMRDYEIRSGDVVVFANAEFVVG